MTAKNRFPSVSTSEALSPAGATLSFNLIGESAAGTIDMSAYRGRICRVQIIGSDVNADVWFDSSDTSTVNTDNDSTAFENGIGDRLYSGHPPTPYVIPGFSGSQFSYLHFNPSASLDIRVTIG